MPWKESEAVPEGNGPVPQKEELESGQLTIEDALRLLIEKLDRMLERMDSCNNRYGMRERGQHLTRLEHGARQPRLAVEADGQESTKTRERTEGAATAVQAMRGDCFSACQVEPGLTTNSTSLGMKADPPVLPCRDDSVVGCGAAAFKSCFPSMEMRTSTAAGGLVPTGDVSKVSETTLDEPPLRFCLTEEPDLKAENSRISIPSASYDSSSNFQERNLSALPYCRRVVDTKSGQNRTFDPGGSRGHLRTCPFWGSWHGCFVARFEGLEQSCSVFSMIRWLFGIRPVLMPRHDIKSRRRGRLEPTWYRNSWEEQRSRRHGDSRRLEVRGERLSRSVMER